ncbi:MAG: EVE domain-containing protein [Candidatus Saccharicenans sp.]|jgi:predicted RNA-binding protein|nr:EVE domain-containing protein [Candidatus Saccharicenans sp.]MDH7574619.1 EVE domain-containing protein [Candidatus Saccharicenans sp.]
MKKNPIKISKRPFVLRYWCISTSPENWEICRNNHVWGMDARYFVTLKSFIRQGDKAVVYTHGGKFVAIIEFIGDYFYSEKYIGWKKGRNKFLFPYRMKIKVLYESKNPPLISFSTEEKKNKAHWIKPNLIDAITFIADKGRTWNQYLQVSIIRITEEDFNTISQAIIGSSKKT